MNRAQRRTMKHKRPQHEKVVPLTFLFQEFSIFDMPQMVIDQICAGSINSIDDIPVFRDNTGEWMEICPALAGWIATWREINPAEPLNALHQINLHLHSNTSIPPELTETARQELNACREYYRSADASKIRETAQKCQIRLMLGTL